MIGWPERIEIDREIETASVNANSVIVNASGESCRKASNENSGSDNGGSVCGIASNITTPTKSAPKWLEQGHGQAADQRRGDHAQTAEPRCVITPVSSVIPRATMPSGWEYSSFSHR